MARKKQIDTGEAKDLPIPRAIAGFVETAAALFDVDRTTSYEYLNRAAALVRTTAALRRGCATSHCQELPRGGLAAWQVARVICHIEDNLSVPMSAKELAAVVNLSPGQFFREFKASLGMPPFQYILRKRVELACKMIQGTDNSLSQIALECGLYDQSHLCRVFRRTMGESPNLWRRRNTGGGNGKLRKSTPKGAAADVSFTLDRRARLLQTVDRRPYI